MGVKSRRGKEGARRFRGGKRSPEKMEQRRTSGGDWDAIFKKDFTAFKAKEGKNTIRIISPDLYFPDPKNSKKEIEVGWVGADYWGKEIFVHNEVGGTFTSYLCPEKMLSKPCPICEDRERASEEAASTGDTSEETEAYIKSLYPRKRILAYVIDRKSDEQEVLVWSMPLTQMEKAIALVSYDEDDNSDIPIDDPDEGYNIHFSFGKDNKSGFYGYSGVKLAKNPSSVEEEFLNFVAENPLPDVLQMYSYERIKEVHTGGSSGASEVDEDELDEAISDSGDQNDNPLTYEKVQELEEDDLFEILDREGSTNEDELDEMNEDELRETVCELFDLHPESKEEVAKDNAKRQRRRRRG
jgi:hypothetical protein